MHNRGGAGRGGYECVYDGREGVLPCNASLSVPAMRRIDCNSIRELQASILILAPPRVLPPPQFPLSPPHRIIPPLSFECLRLRCAFMLFAQIVQTAVTRCVCVCVRACYR